MPMSWRLTRPFLLVTLLVALLFPLAAGPVVAQDGGEDESPPVIIQGSTELEPLVGALRDAFNEEFPSIEVTLDPRGGQRAAFDALCSGGDVDIVMSTEPIDDGQVADCAQQGNDFVEVVLGYDAVVLLAAPEADITCLPPQTVYDVWELGAPADVLWTDLGALELDTPVAFYGPDDSLKSYDLFRLMTPVESLRDDIVGTTEIGNVLDKVAEEGASAFGFMSLAEFDSLDNEAGLVPLELRDAQGACYGPSVSTISNGSYPLARTDYLYVAADSAQNPDVLAFLQFVLKNEAGITAIGAAQGYTLADAGTYDFGVSNLTTLNVGRTFTRPPSPVTLSTAEFGTVSITGTSVLRDLTHDLEDVFTSQYPQAQVYFDAVGNTQGWADFCAGNADVMAATRVPTQDELDLCAENGIDPHLVDLGYEAMVVAVPESNTWLDCLTPDRAATLFRAGTEEVPAVTMWNEVSEGWAESEILLVAPPRNTGETDFLMFHLTGDLTLPVRTDMLEDDDAAYRLQGVGNTDNGLTWAWWTDAQGVEADVQYVPVGDGCVLPLDANITDGFYPMGFPVRYYVAGSEFENPFVRAFLWNFYTESSVAEYAQRGYLGLDIEGIEGSQREDMYAMLAQVEDDLDAAAAEAGDQMTGDDTTGDDAGADTEGDTESTGDDTGDDAGTDTEGDTESTGDDTGGDAGTDTEGDTESTGDDTGDDAGADDAADSGTSGGE